MKKKNTFKTHLIYVLLIFAGIYLIIWEVKPLTYLGWGLVIIGIVINIILYSFTNAYNNPTYIKKPPIDNVERMLSQGVSKETADVVVNKIFVKFMENEHNKSLGLGSREIDIEHYNYAEALINDAILSEGLNSKINSSIGSPID